MIYFCFAKKKKIAFALMFAVKFRRSIGEYQSVCVCQSAVNRPISNMNEVPRNGPATKVTEHATLSLSLSRLSNRESSRTTVLI